MAVYRIAGFEVDEELRQLRLHGGEVTLQPRAFDVLAYLIRNRTRVVNKEELLEALWPGVIVTDSSVQRAVSLARTALRSGGLPDAIRTHARRGYRFVAEPAPDSTAAPPPADDLLHQARASFGRGAWAEAADAFEAVDGEAPLAAGDLESWGIALQCSGSPTSAVAPFQRAAELYSGSNECEPAARAMNALARLHFELGEWAVAKGCLRRAGRMLQKVPLCSQHGHLAWIRGWLASYEGDFSSTLDFARQTVDIARQLADADLEAMGLLFQGIALQATGETEQGLELQDEAGAAVLTGSVTPLLGGLVYCGLIGGCCNAGDWPRAGQWCESFTEWCRRNGMLRFSGSCLLHRVEVFIARGELLRAEAELHDNEHIIAGSTAAIVADARRFRADVHLLRGELEEADSAYRAAYELGGNPNPGYALLLHRRGQSAAAVRTLERAAADARTWASRECRPSFLAHAAMVAAQSGDTGAAHRIIDELDRQPGSWALGTTRAHVLRARAELRLSQCDAEEAVSLFRSALHIYHAMDALLDAASVRLRLAAALVAIQDHENAALELGSAESVLVGNGALLCLDDCRKLEAVLQAKVR